ncbi:MerR family transcriptional regulator [Nocardioides guangzhouensis]|uniref:MerR family transcriptional regulator n=1 Tax=Nocardioides guangzhouensis TaxID=2497878 RepID=A0A4Q4ZLG3_9ACTN|nr:MerR family transcriptional regulator [Nocardioides guangzhouensis]RYP88898.1 MerR family transcriptional regulator [Nocardioides guangzhouensis]
MRISKLSELAGLPVGTVKFYLRTGLLHPGRATSATQAQYNDSHVERLKLIRALLEVGRLPLADIQRVFDAMDLPTQDPAKSVALVQQAISPEVDHVEDEDLTRARTLVDDLGWSIAQDSPHLPPLAQALHALDNVGQSATRERLKVYAEAASHVARNDVDVISDADDVDKPVVAAISSAIYESLFAALHRLAVENQTARRGSRIPGPRVSIPQA